MLEGIGVDVTVAADGLEALEKAGTHTPEIVLMDIRMPRMDGMEAMRQLRQKESTANTRIVAVSASTFEHERQEYLAEGFDAFVAKPVDTSDLYECMADLLGVEYVFAESAETLSELVEPETIALPSTLRARLLEAASLAQVTALEQGLEEVEQLGADEAGLAEQLRLLSQDFRFEEIARLLERVNVTG